RDVVLAERDRIASGATGKAMGGFRQQFSTEPEVRLAQESAKLFHELGSPLFEAVGYMFLATTDDGWSRLRERAAIQQSLGGPVADLPLDLPMTIEDETTFHFRRRGDTLRLAMTEAVPRWTRDVVVDDELVADWRGRLAYRYPPAGSAPVVRAWAGLYDMTPDAHPIIGWAGDGVYAACGFSGHGFMQSPAVGSAVAHELLHGTTPLDLTPYRLDRFATGSSF